MELKTDCSAIIQKSQPLKSSGPGSSTLLVIIGSLIVDKALLDLGVSINLMPLSMLKRIVDVEVQSTKMALQLVDRSIKYPYEIVEDLLVKVDRFYFAANFVVMDIEEDSKVSLILGRPFMKIAKAIIDVDNGKLKVRMQDEEVIFNVFEVVKHPNNKNDCFRMDALYDVCLEFKETIVVTYPREGFDKSTTRVEC